MGLSIFLAKLIGLYLLIVAAIWIFRKDQFDKSIRDIASSRGLIVLSGVMSLLSGLAIAIGHSIWQFSWIGLITLLGYLMIIQGVVRLIFPEKLQTHMLEIMDKGYWAFIAIMIILGGFLTYSGFVH